MDQEDEGGKLGRDVQATGAGVRDLGTFASVGEGIEKAIDRSSVLCKCCRPAFPWLPPFCVCFGYLICSHAGFDLPWRRNEKNTIYEF